MSAGTQRTLRLIGPTRTKLLLFTGKRLSGAEAVSWGLADILSDNPEEVSSSSKPIGSAIDMGVDLSIAVWVGSDGMSMPDGWHEGACCFQTILYRASSSLACMHSRM